MEIALEAGADDVADAGGAWEVTCEPADFLTVKDAIVAAEIDADSAEVTFIPANTVACDLNAARKVMRLVENIEEHDDVQKVYTNADIPDEVMAELD